MALWGNKDLVYSDGTISVDLGAKTITGSGTTFTTAGITTGNVVTVGTGATYGYAVVASVTSNTVISIAETSHFVSGVSTVPTSTAYQISEEPIYVLGDSHYRAPEAKSVGAGVSFAHFSGVFGVDRLEVAVAAATTVGGKNAAYAVAHSGWVGITTYVDGDGNFRVKSEVLVAGGISTTADAADDARFPE